MQPRRSVHSRSRRTIAAAMAAALALMGSAAAAQSIDPTSPLRAGTPDAGVTRAVTQPAQKRAPVTPPADPDAPPAGEAAPPPQPKTRKVSTFKIAHIRFEGNTVLSTNELAALAKKYENRLVTLKDLKELTATVRGTYQKRGYILARAAIPPQKLMPGGDVRVVVSEGRYGETKVEGNKHYSERFVKHFFERARSSGIVEEARLQRTLLLLNELPDITVRSLFLPGEKSGTSDVLLRVQDRQSFHYGLDYNNYGSPLVGRNRAGLALWLGSMFFEGDELTGRYTEPFPSRSDPLYQAGYAVPIGTDGNRLLYSFAAASTNVSGELALLDIRGKAEIHGLQFLRPIQRTLDRSTNLSSGFVFKTVENFVLGTTRVSKDDLRLFTVGIDTNVVAGKARTLASAVMTLGLGELFSGNRQGDAESSRVGSGNEFGKLNVELFHVRQLAQGRFILGRFSGQLSADPLTVSEQFALGGPDSVRGYIQSDYLGDNGYSTSIELRQALYSSKKKTVNIQGVLFVDHGGANLQLPQVGERESRSFTGAGAGLRGSVGRTTSIRLDVGSNLTDRNSLRNKDAILYAQVVNRW